MSTLQSTQQAGRLLHRPVATGPAFWGPGDHYTFLVTGEESGGAYFALEALVPPGGGPPPHIHTREDETFYILDGEIEILLGDRTVMAGPSDFVNIPRGTVHRFRNTGSGTARIDPDVHARGHRALVHRVPRARAEPSPARGRARQPRGGRGALRRRRPEIRARVRLTAPAPAGPPVIH